MIHKRWKIPNSWEWVNLGEVSRIVSGGTPKTNDQSNFDSNGIPWITPADLSGYRSAYISRGRRSLSDKGYNNSSAQLVPKNTVLFSSRAPIGYCVIAENDISTSQGFKSFVMRGQIDPQYTRYYLLYSTEYIESLASGTTFKELSSAKAANISFPLAPLSEQNRIVSKIVSLEKKSKIAYDHLQSIPKLIEKYKQSILEAAFKGDLTRSWRATRNLSLPSFVELKDVVVNFSYGTSSKSSPTGLIPVIRMGNIQDGKIEWNNLAYTSDSNEIEKYSLEVGDVLFNRTNSPELVGKTAIYNGEYKAIYAGYLIRIRCSDRLLPQYLNYCLNSPAGKAYCRMVKVDGINQSNINAKKLAAFQLPLPSIEEQIDIVNQVEHAFKWINQISQDVTFASKLIRYLDQSILSKAFKGELVTQEPDEEKAQELIDRLNELGNKELIKKVPQSKIKRKKDKEIMAKKLIDVLSEEDGWLDAQDAFYLCGITSNSTTEEIEPIYSELRKLDQEGQILIEPVRGENGKKLYDRIKLKKQANHAT